jgi:pimeloyl-ACP methyl ester carboxylesterase
MGIRSSSVFFVFLAVCLAPGVVLGEQERPDGPVTETGEINGVPFRIDIPGNWTGGLVMFARGYSPVSQSPDGSRKRQLPRRLYLVEPAARLGYAVAESLYDRGHALREGVLDIEAVRRHFVDTYGPTDPTIMAGVLQGALITYHTIERYPEIYDGALAMNGTAEPMLKFIKEQVFDTRLLFDYYFPGLPGSATEFPDGLDTMSNVSAKAKELIAAHPERAREFIRLRQLKPWRTEATIDSLNRTIAFFSEILRELEERAGGNAFDNRNTIYFGLDDHVTLNREIPRFEADPRAVEYLQQWSTPTGRISDPVVAVNSLDEPIIPTDKATSYYEQLTATAGTSQLYVQLFVDRPGHIPLAPEEMAEALRLLNLWITEGVRPKPGDITRSVDSTSSTPRRESAAGGGASPPAVDAR